VEAWTDERLDDLAATLRPLPVEFGEVRAELAAVRAEVAKLTEAVNHLHEDNRAIRADLSALHRQIAQIGWGLSAALVGVLVALVFSVM
jgi:septal ring factor EnvC (AmiA/AmiB activator)